MTLSIMALSIMILSIMILSIMTLSKMTFSIKIPKSGSTNRRGRLSTLDLPIKEAWFVK
jgi:hypothetical protein